MRKGFCKHHTSPIHNDTCRARVEYKSVTPNPELPGSLIRRPCNSNIDDHAKRVLEEYGPKGTCEKFEEPTAAEIEASEEEWRKAIENLTLAGPIIARVKEEHAGESWQGTEECPVCKGILHLTHANTNGHVWGQCETKNCLNWME